MKCPDIEKLKTAANNLLFDMSDEEYKTLHKEFETVIEQMNVIADDKSIDTYEPMYYPFPCKTSFLREDVPEKTLDRNEALKNAKNKVAGQIKVPKVVS